MNVNALWHRLTPVLLFFGTLALYGMTLTEVHTFDALSYIHDVELKPLAELFHPHHLAYGPLGALAFAFARMLGYAGRAALPIQVVNVWAGAMGVLLLFVVLRDLTGRVIAPLAGALVLGASYAYWYYAVEVEVYTIAALFLILCLWLLLRLLRHPSLTVALALGIAQGGATLFHQTNVLLCVPVGLALLLMRAHWWRTREGWQRTLGVGVAYAVPLLLVVVGSYLWVGFGVSGFRGWEPFWAWLTGYARTGWWGGPITEAKWADLGTGLAQTIAETDGIGIGLVLVFGMLWGVWFGPRREVAIVLTWLLVYGGFFFWWEPDNIEFWIASLPPALTLIVIGLSGKPRRRSGDGGCRGPKAPEKPFSPFLGSSAAQKGGKGRVLPLQQDAPERTRKPEAVVFNEESQPRNWVAGASMVGTFVFIGCGVALLLLNGPAIRQRGDASTDQQRMIVTSLESQSSLGDLFLVPDGLQELYLPYYAQRFNVLSLNQALYERNGAWEAVCALVHGRIDETLASGFGVLVGEEVVRPSEARLPNGPGMGARGRLSLLERFGLTQAQVDACFAPYMASVQPITMPTGLPTYYRIAAAEALLAGDGWDFRRGRWGWTVANGVDLSKGPDALGWEILPGADPWFVSPLMRVDTAHYDAVEITLAASTEARDAQLFFLEGQGSIDESRSIRWQLDPGNEVHTYRIALRDRPFWHGVFSGLRLDPVGAGDGGWVRVVGVRMVR